MMRLLNPIAALFLLPVTILIRAQARRSRGWWRCRILLPELSAASDAGNARGFPP